MSNFLIPTLIAGLLILVFYRRARRLFGGQKLSVVRLVVRTVFAGGVGAFLVLLPSSPILVRAAGIGLGTALAVGGVLTTKTERVDGDCFYTPNPIFGMIVLGLLLGPGI